MKKMVICFLFLASAFVFNAFAFEIDAETSKTTKFYNQNTAMPTAERPASQVLYAKNVVNKVKTYWFPASKHNESFVLAIGCKLDRDGNIIETKMNKTSPYPEEDKAALNAIKKAAPFEKIPDEIDEKDITINIVFRYDVSPDNSGAKLSVYSNLNLPWGPYMSKLERKIKSNWRPLKKYDEFRVVVFFEVNADGSISNVKISKPSPYPDEDQIVLDAVKSVSSYEKLPEGFSGKSVPVEFTFEYRIKPRIRW